MAQELYVGNMSYGTTDSDLLNLFLVHGTVQSAQVILDRDESRSKGFGLIEMDTPEQAQATRAALKGQQVNGRALTVPEARPQAERGGSNRGVAGSSGRDDRDGDRSY